MNQRLLALLLTIPLAACKGSASPAGSTSRVLEFPALDAAAGAEVLDVCQSVTLGNDEPIFVNAVEMAAGPAWHHSNWFYVPDTKFDGPDGTWTCSSRNFDEVAAGGAGGVLFAQSTQSTGETQQFPAGAAIRIPPHSRVVGGLHLVNASTSGVHTAITLTLDLIPESQVAVRLKALALEYYRLDIPAHARSRFTGHCDSQGGVPFDFSIYYILPHYHRFGTGMTLAADGPAGFAPIFENSAGVGEAWGRTLDPPMDVRGQTRLDFSCGFNNTTDAPLSWGNAGGEMCVLLAYTDSPAVWAGGVFQTNAVVGTDGNGVILNEGPCGVGGI